MDARAPLQSQIRSAHRQRRAFFPAAFHETRLNNQRAKESRGRFLRSSRARATTSHRQRDDLRWNYVRGSDGARNPCHAIIRRLPKYPDLHLAIVRNASSNPPRRNSVFADFPIEPIREEWPALEMV